jgi:hypothetical protein
MKRVPAAVQGREPKLMSVDEIEKPRPCSSIAQKPIHVAMRSRRKISRSDLNSLNT